MKIKTNHTKELWETIYQWLRLHKVDVNKHYCKEEITTHPDYPALTSVTDFLDSGNMAYHAVQADTSHIHEFNYPLLVHIRNVGQENLKIINNIDDWDKQKEVTQHWTGITLFAEKNTNWYNAENVKQKTIELKNKIFSTVLLITAFGVFITTSLQQGNLLRNVFGLFSLIGLIVSIITLGAEMGFQNEIVKQVCGAGSKGGCTKVLQSKPASGFINITPADAAVLYFGTQFILYCLSSLYFPLIQSMLFFAVVAVTAVAWSFYMQAVKLKQWCTLCLIIDTILIAQFIIATIAWQSLQGFATEGIFAVLFIVLALLLLPIKQLIKINYSNKIKLAELKKWKMDAGLFLNQWQQTNMADITMWHDDLILGDAASPLRITVACNPYCGPCAGAHIQLDDLLEKFESKVNVQVRLLCNAEDETDKRTIATKSLLQKSRTVKNNTELQQMFSDWFLLMDYERWAQKWKPDNNIDVGQRLHQHAKWVKENEIAFTPTIFLNGRQLPGRYGLNDLKILIPQLVKMTQVKNGAVL